MQRRQRIPQDLSQIPTCAQSQDDRSDVDVAVEVDVVVNKYNHRRRVVDIKFRRLSQGLSKKII